MAALTFGPCLLGNDAPMSNLRIEEVGTDDPRLLALIALHKDAMAALTPPNSGHAIDPAGPDLSTLRYWLAIDDGTAAGCIGLSGLDTGHAEIKTMHVLTAHRGKGIARALLDVLEAEAWRAGITRLSLETGKSDGFRASRSLYERAGFEACASFGAYVGDPFSYCMTKAL